MLVLPLSPRSIDTFHLLSESLLLGCKRQAGAGADRRTDGYPDSENPFFLSGQREYPGIPPDCQGASRTDQTCPDRYEKRKTPGYLRGRKMCIRDRYTSFIVKILSIVSRIALTSLVWIRYNEASGYFYDKAKGGGIK